MGLRPTKTNENPLDAVKEYPPGIAGRRGLRGNGEVETDRLSDPERAHGPMIVRRPPLAGPAIARDAACF
jgi:hypothetical protein